jgi:hypothetical protein
MPTTGNEKLVLAYRTLDFVEVRSLAAQLEDADIATHIIGDYRDSAYSGLLVGSMADKEIWISERDEPAAEMVVAQWRRMYHPNDLKPTANWQFSLRTALVVVTLAALGFALYRTSPQVFRVALAVIPYLLFAFYVVRRLARRRRDDDEEPVAIEQVNQRT